MLFILNNLLPQRTGRNFEYSMMEFNEWFKDVLRLECQLFMKTDSYRLIGKNPEGKCLSPDERNGVHAEIHAVFKRLMNTLQNVCSGLTKEDIIFCCLVKLGLNNSTIGCCMGSMDRHAINQRKYRIKKKMKTTHCEDLFDLIYSADDFA